MNELILFIHIFLVVAVTFFALRLGKEALIALISLQAILANVFVLKQITLFGFNSTCSDVFAVGSLLGLTLLQNYFGKESARRAIWISFFSMVFFALVSQIHLLYIPNLHDTSHPHFYTLLAPAPRLLLASLLSFFLVQHITVMLFKRWSTTLSLIFAQAFDTALFTFLGLWGIVSALGSIMLIGFTIKLIIIFCMTPLILFAKRYVRHEI